MYLKTRFSLLPLCVTSLVFLKLPPVCALWLLSCLCPVWMNLLPLHPRLQNLILYLCLPHIKLKNAEWSTPDFDHFEDSLALLNCLWKQSALHGLAQHLSFSHYFYVLTFSVDIFSHYLWKIITCTFAHHSVWQRITATKKKSQLHMHSPILWEFFWKKKIAHIWTLSHPYARDSASNSPPF